MSTRRNFNYQIKNLQEDGWGKLVQVIDDKLWDGFGFPLLAQQKLDKLEQNSQSGLGGAIPIGGIIMWSGSVIPEGWALCNGQNGTPDLTDKFIVGSGTSYTIGNTGGNDDIILNVDQLPPHNHNATFVGDQLPPHNHTIQTWNEETGDPTKVPEGDTPSESHNSAATSYNSAGTPSGTVTIDNTGLGSPIDIRPKYYSLAFIMRTI